MLVALRVENFILMETLELRLEPGFNVLTGETGAGKSIVVGALALVLGGRASSEHVRPGADEAVVEALFDVGTRALDGGALARLAAEGLIKDGEVAIRRVVSAGGRSRAYLNGRLCTAAELAELAPELADVASQHESTLLTDPATHIHHLDQFGKLIPKRKALAEKVAELEALLAEIRELRDKERTRGEREAFVAFQLQAIDALDPKGGEIDTLEVERKRLRHAGRLLELTRKAADALVGDDALGDRLGRVVADLAAAAELDPVLQPPSSALESAYTDIQEVGRACARYAEASEIDPSRLGIVEDRLYRLEGLLRQHGPTIDDVLEAAARLREEQASLERAESTIEERQESLRERLPAIADEARDLSARRQKAAKRLGEAISAELAELGMGGARVLVEVEAVRGAPPDELSVDGARLRRSGLDRVEFLIAPNRGIEPRPLRKIASGGELSRSLLALKRVLAEGGPAGLYVFDEVDAGVGGAVAERIGAAIADIARHHQVLCITHLAPIAAYSDAHFVVHKDDSGGVTRSGVERVVGKERVQETARMLAGQKVTPAALKAAREMIDHAKASPGRPTEPRRAEA